MKLSEFFTDEKLVRDAHVKLTHFANQSLDGIICFALNEGYVAQANKNENVKAVITYDKYKDLVHSDKGLIISDNPKNDYYLLHNYMFEHGYMNMVGEYSIAKSAQISPTAIIEKNVIIGENVIIGDYSIIKSQTMIGDNTYIGSHCIIGARGLNNTRIDDDFIYVYDAGGVKIGKNCEVLDASIIQKSIHREMTSVGDNTKISVHVNIGHGTIIGKRTLIAGSAQIAGYVSIGNDVWIGPSSVISHNLKVLDNAEIKIGSVVVKNVKKDAVVSGSFAYDHNKNLKNYIKAQR